MRQKPRAQGPWVWAGCDVRAHQNSSGAVQWTLWWATSLPLEDWGIYSSTADSIGHWQLTAESLAWDSPITETKLLPQVLPFLQEESGEANIWWQLEKGYRGLDPLPQFRIFLKSHPRFRAPPGAPPQFNLSLFLIQFPSLPFRFVPSSFSNQFPECKSLPQNLFLGGLDLWWFWCQK